MGGFAGLTDKRFGRPFWFLRLFRLFLAGGFETLELLVRLKGAWSIRVLPGWIFEAIGVAEGGVRSGQNLPCFSLGSIGAGALPRGVGAANCGDLPLFASLCGLHWPFMEMKMGAARHFSTEQSQFLVSHLLSYCPSRFEHVQSEPARESPEEPNSLASRPKASSGWRKRLPQWEREGLRASSRFRLAYRRLNAGHWLVGNGNVLVCAPELEHRPDPKIENIEPWAIPDPGIPSVR